MGRTEDEGGNKMIANKYKIVFRLISNSILVIKDFSMCVSFLTFSALYPLIMYRFEVEYVPALSYPSYAFAALFFIYFAKTINSVCLLCANVNLFERLKHEWREMI